MRLGGFICAFYPNIWCLTSYLDPLMAVSKHLKVMGKAGLIRREKDGRVRRCSFDPGSIKGAGDWIEAHRRFWTQQLDSLAAFLEEPGTGAGSERLPNGGGEPR